MPYIHAWFIVTSKSPSSSWLRYLRDRHVPSLMRSQPIKGEMSYLLTRSPAVLRTMRHTSNKYVLQNGAPISQQGPVLYKQFGYYLRTNGINDFPYLK